MKKIRKLIYVTAAVLCLNLLGGWTANTEQRYADAPTYSLYAVETVAFDKKETDAKLNSSPQYAAINGMTNACGAVAGAEIVAYYDKYYSEMIPDWQSYYPASGKYRPQDKVYIPNLMNEFYSLMRINVNGAGVSDSNFLNGLTQYINGKGYSVSMQNVVSGTSIDYAACKAAINNNKAIALLSRAVDVYKLTDGTTQDSISSITISDLHIMVAFGYKEVKYYRGNNVFRTDRYLLASSGLSGVGTVYYKVNPHSLNYEYVVNIS